MKNKKLYSETMALLRKTTLKPKDIADKIKVKVTPRWVSYLIEDANGKEPKNLVDPGVHKIQAVKDFLLKVKK